VAGWISKLFAWREVIRDLTQDFEIFYVETREKISSRIQGNVEYGVQDIGSDLAYLLPKFNLKNRGYLLMGSSLGATAILDCAATLDPHPLALILVAPNAVFRVPWWGLALIRPFPPRLYLIFKPFIKWYLRTFRLNVKEDYAQYEKYALSLDAADPWKLKKGIFPLAKYSVWEKLNAIHCPVLVVGASKDKLHEPENLRKMVALLPNARYVDLETNQGTHSNQLAAATRNFLQQIH
jgi:pimeloyl-ACP methyl ester carboxylesterase